MNPFIEVITLAGYQVLVNSHSIALIAATDGHTTLRLTTFAGPQQQDEIHTAESVQSLKHKIRHALTPTTA
ncbi:MULTISPECIES: hypothetical protein [Hymenobacter]|uniref:Uncharacterized protein n=1 Tax=Hymenobacter jejuensis TaxID=2502781 RepID=A0A5B7ZWK3_9BACT|nr:MULTISPECIES: hypothetical protein [Hymenobacter]MBC6988702.1 hypothetical protein [Hymenobacter sp. BT491]QDA58985.1 hypothetical protein FHG12_02190 [Hymenobacter jejuensis]